MTIKQAVRIIGGLGTASKMPCHVFSIAAILCRRGSRLRRVNGSVCSKCYARKGRFAFSNIKKALLLRAALVSHPLWPEAMVMALNQYEKSGFFRWFSSGDLQCLSMLEKICVVVRHTPHIQHWLSTRETDILLSYLLKHRVFPNNLTVRVSADMIHQEKFSCSFLSEDLLAAGVVTSSTSSTNVADCPAYYNHHKCGQCRKCWDKNVSHVTYKLH